MSNINKVAKELKKALTESDERKPRAYDTEATVVRVDGNTLWVNFPGGENETPVRRTVDAKPGDNIMVRVANHRAWTAGNSTSPPTDDTRANIAYKIARVADENAEAARNAADKAEADAERAHAAADSAEQSAQEAKQDAAIANVAATEAKRDAGIANTAANSAITQLGVVEDVVDVLGWISEHATYKVSTDTEVVAGKMYFSKNGDVYTPIANPSGNPSTLGYYEIDSIDEAVTNYVSSHLALTNDGLWVVNDNNSYKILLASDGMKVYDASGNLITTFGENITFSSSVAQYIGGENAYIVFNPDDGSMIIGGSKVNISGNINIGGQTRPLSQVISEMQTGVNNSIKIVEYAVGTSPTIHPTTGWSTNSPSWESGKYIWMRQSKDGTAYTYTCIQGAKGDNGEDAVVLRIDSSRGTVFKNNQVSTVLTVTVFSGQDIIKNISALHNRFGNNAYLQWYWQKIDESDYGIIVNTDHKLSNDGFTLTLTPDEVDVKVTFRCELLI